MNKDYFEIHQEEYEEIQRVLEEMNYDDN